MAKKAKTKTKMKTNRGACKRFKKTGSGKYKCRGAGSRHIFTNKTTDSKRHRRGLGPVAEADERAVARLLRDK